MSAKSHADRPLLLLLSILLVGGALIFISAASGLLARGAVNISTVVFNHLVLGIGIGLIALVAASRIDYRKWRRVAPFLFALALIATALVFLPQLGISHGGGRRWLDLGGMSFQPAEALKLAVVAMSAAYFSAIRPRIGSFIYSFGGLSAILLAPVALLILQPDIGTLGVIIAAALAVFVAAGAPWRHIFIVLLLIPVFLAVLAMNKPYVRDRIVTFFHPAQNQQAEGYQIRQALIAVGSGGLLGRGFGQGIQKFTYLPEPMGDSIFAVVGEEFGFIGSVFLVILFLLFALRGFWIAARAPDPFGGLLAVGISAYLAGEAFINIAAMLGAAPITGIPLTFVSQGGSAMLVSLASAGILLNVSKNMKKA